MPGSNDGNGSGNTPGGSAATIITVVCLVILVGIVLWGLGII